MCIRDRLAQHLVEDADWVMAPPEHQKQSGLPLFKSGTDSYGIDFTAVSMHARNSFLSLSDDQIYWIRCEDFIAMTRPETSPHLEGLVIETSNCGHVDHIRNENGKLTFRRKGTTKVPEVGYVNGVCDKMR